jgi:hypothetical protein
MPSTAEYNRTDDLTRRPGSHTGAPPSVLRLGEVEHRRMTGYGTAAAIKASVRCAGSGSTGALRCWWLGAEMAEGPSRDLRQPPAPVHPRNRL